MLQDTIKIAPSILAADFARLGEQVAEAECSGADRIHVDVMDGISCPTFQWVRMIPDRSGQAPNLFCMKLKILKTLADDCLKFLKPKTPKPPQEPQNPNSTEEEQLREALLLIQAEENSGPTDHRHWGLNE